MPKLIRTAAVGLFIGAACQGAGAASLSVQQLQALVDGLGYQSTTSGGDTVSIDNQGKARQRMDLILSRDQSILYVEVPFQEIPADKKAAIPLEDLLKANDAGPFAYAIHAADDGTEWIVLQETLDAGAINKQALRQTIDGLVTAVDAGEPLWDQDQWTTAAAAPTLDAAKAALDDAWQKGPMRIDHAMFVTEEAPMFGGYTGRTDDTFKPSEPLIAYVEPKSYTWKKLDDGKYTFGLGVDLAILDSNDQVVLEKKQFLSQSFKSSDKVSELMFNLTTHLDGFPAGTYKMRYSIHDLNSDKSADVTLPFKLESAAK